MASEQVVLANTFLPFQPMPTIQVPPAMIGESPARVIDTDRVFETIVKTANEHFSPAAILAHSGYKPPSSVPIDLWDRKLSRLRWRYNRQPRGYEIVLNIPVMSQYKKTFHNPDAKTLMQLWEQAEKAVGKTIMNYEGKTGHLIYYYLARPPVITPAMVVDFLVHKYGLTPVEQKYLRFMKIAPAHTPNKYESYLLWNISPQDLWDRILWLQSPELLYRPTGPGYQQIRDRWYKNIGKSPPEKPVFSYDASFESS